MNEFVESELYDLFKFRKEFKELLQETIDNLNDGGNYEEAEHLSKMDWNEVMEFTEL